MCLTHCVCIVVRGYKMTYSVSSVNEGVVDSDNIDITVLDGIAKDDTANAAKTVDTSLDNHFDWES